MRTKILLLSAIFFFTFFVSNAQVKTGRCLLGGGFSYYNATNESNKSFYLNIQAGKVIKDNTVIGIIGSHTSNNFYNTPSHTKMRQYSLGAFYR